MKAKLVPSSWLVRDGRRLDCNPYMSGALEAKVILDSLSVAKVLLADVCLNGRSGLVNAGRIKRLWVSDEQHGVRFLSSTDILKADLSDLQLISKQAVRANPKLLIKSGWTLITRAGTVGRMAFARTDMDGLACSEDVLRVVPDPKKIPPGYLYAYLSSKFGVPLVAGGTYGAIIQHIEPEHIASLPVPRFGAELESEAHQQIVEASDLRAKAQSLLNGATSRLLHQAKVEDYPPARWHGLGPDLAFSAKPGTNLILRALPYAPRFQRILSQLRATHYLPLGRICEGGYLGTGARFKRIDCDPEHGVRLVGQREGFWQTPVGRWVSAARAPDDIFAADETVLIASSGTLGENEVYCRPIFVTGSWLKHAYTQHFFRVVSGEPRVPGAYLFAFLRSELAFRCLRSMSTGSKQQEIHRDLVAQFPVPLLPQSEIEAISENVRNAFRMRERADALDLKAVSLVEDAIEGDAN